MELKKEIELLLEKLKEVGYNRGRIEKELGYSDNYINQTLSKGGNKRFLVALHRLQSNVLQNPIQNIVQDSGVDYVKQGNEHWPFIELITASGKILKVKPEGETEINLLNAFLEERNRLIFEKEERKKDADMRAERAEKEKERLFDIIEKYLVDIRSDSKTIKGDFSALKTEVQTELRAIMDSIDQAAKLPMGTTRAAAGTVESASRKVRPKKGKKAGGK
jgi:hypothetical protein